MQQRFDTVVLGAGLRGLTAGLRSLRAQTGASLLVVDAAPRPGGSIRTQRSNGFLCELGPFAFDRATIAPAMERLARPPAPIDARTATGHVFTGAGLAPTTVEPLPVSFATGAEELPQACRRELAAHLLLGRAATTIERRANGFGVTLGGEAPTAIETARLVMALPLRATALLLAPFDRELAPLAERLRSEPRAFAFFGGDASAARELLGYGIVPGDGVDSPICEAIFCDQVFPGRSLPGRCLVRCELAGAGLDAGDEQVLSGALDELRRWTGTRAPFPFSKLHRFDAEPSDGAAVECRVRLRYVAARFADLILP